MNALCAYESVLETKFALQCLKKSLLQALVRLLGRFAREDFGSQGLLTTASKTKGEYAFNFSTVPFLAEIVKLLISFWLLQRQKKLEPEVFLLIFSTLGFKAK